MVENPRTDFDYDRSTTGWESKWITVEHTLEDGSVVRTTGSPESRVRPESDRERCGPYTSRDGGKVWGDHRVTERGTTCEQVQCTVKHHPDIVPGWAEPHEGFHEREGVQPIAAALWGWNGGDMLPRALGDNLAWVAAHVAIDALRDAGYVIVKREQG